MTEGEKEKHWDKSGGTVDKMINGIDQALNHQVHILLCLHSPIATVLN